jgi:hypothetical protein
MSRHRVETRLASLESRHATTVSGDYLARLARHYDLDEAELIAEAERLVRGFHQAGAVTLDQQFRYLAAEQGMSLDDCRAQLAVVLAVEA